MHRCVGWQTAKLYITCFAKQLLLGAQGRTPRLLHHMSERTLIHDCQYWSCKSAPKSINTTNHLLLQTQVNSAAPTGLNFFFCKYVCYIKSKHLIKELIRDIDLFANMTRLQTSSSNIPAIISLIVKQSTTKLQFSVVHEKLYHLHEFIKRLRSQKLAFCDEELWMAILRTQKTK